MSDPSPHHSRNPVAGSCLVGVLPLGVADEAQASAWARELDMPLLAQGDPREMSEPLMVLRAESGRATLSLTGPRAPGPLEVDFGSATLLRRVRQGISQSLARSCGLRSGRRPRILDATAGLGRDAFVLAALGSSVTMVERNPVLHLLLDLALRRLHEGSRPLDGLEQRLDLQHGDARPLLAGDGPFRPEVVYLDPMFPPRKKKALVKKEMQILHVLLGEEEPAESDALLMGALGCASERVVVKRPRIAPPLGGKKPDHSFVGRSHRYDLYLIPQSEPDSAQ